MTNNLLLLHGALGSQDQFQELKNLLAPRFNVYTLNFSGHNGEEFENEFSIDLFQKDVLRFMKHHSLEQTSILGYSMGGYVALKFAMDFPEKVEKIMTLGTKIDWNPDTAAQELKMLNPEKIEMKVPRFAKILQESYAPADWKTVVSKTAAMIQGLGNGDALKTENFRQIKTPVLAAIGSEDAMVSREETQALAQHLKQGKYLEIEDFPHPIGQVNQKRLSKIMSGYFSE